jgi:hypothetical protein
MKPPRSRPRTHEAARQGGPASDLLTLQTLQDAFRRTSRIPTEWLRERQRLVVACLKTRRARDWFALIQHQSEIVSKLESGGLR